ncbi:MAG: LysR family transcriptional regulator [Neisseriaceae bacterium]|nr:LysR family transcriptional regulator [Neisseriaceae bacterium]MBP6861004.1 LysR family transcriptional regulator [Neisseriaceae bacterium]
MNLKQLRHFVAVAEELHFGRAAQKLHMSQPPLSLSIQQLEKTLGFSLLIRNNKSVTLTNAGAVFYQEAITLLRHAQEMKDVSARVAQGLIGRLRIGFVGSMLFRGLAQSVRAFERTRSGAELVLLEMNTTQQIDAIRREQIDIGFIHTSLLNDSAHVTSRLLMTEPFICCLPKTHPLSSHARIAVADLAQEGLLLFPRALSPHYHDRITAICVNAGFSPYICHEVRNWLTIVEFVGQGLGIALVPESMQKADTDQVVYRPIDQTQIQSETHCIWHPHNDAPLLKHFLRDMTAAQ